MCHTSLLLLLLVCKHYSSVLLQGCANGIIEPRIGVIFWSTRNTMSEENLGSHDKVGGKVVANGTL